MRYGRGDFAIPEDISVVGYDGINIARVLEPKLTTLCQDTAIDWQDSSRKAY